MEKSWEKIVFPSDEDEIWQLFHENTKNSHLQESLLPQEILNRLSRIHECLDFVGYPVVCLPAPNILDMTLCEAMTIRRSKLPEKPSPLELEDIATLLKYAYGANSARTGDNPFRTLRMVPSAGTLYPLEIFFNVTIKGSLETGLYHFHPIKNEIRKIRNTVDVSQVLLQPNIVTNSSVIFFLTSIFDRSVFKYGNRGYRYCLIEAGHVAQNMNLVACALGLSCVNLGGFFDRRVDQLLGLDGITHSTIYLVAIGSKTSECNV